MTTKKASDFNAANEAAPTIQPDFLTVEPFDEDGGDLCPDGDAIVRFAFGAPDADPSLKYHILVCADCRIEVDALRGAMDRIGEEDLTDIQDAS